MVFFSFCLKSRGSWCCHALVHCPNAHPSWGKPDQSLEPRTPTRAPVCMWQGAICRLSPSHRMHVHRKLNAGQLNARQVLRGGRPMRPPHWWTRCLAIRHLTQHYSEDFFIDNTNRRTERRREKDLPCTSSLPNGGSVYRRANPKPGAGWEMQLLGQAPVWTWGAGAGVGGWLLEPSCQSYVPS